jgi:hypothetical protein
MDESIIEAYSGMLAAFNNKDGLVVASTGEYFLIASMSPVSATTVVTFFNEESKSAMLILKID